MNFTVCPFCGVVSDRPHDTQEACILALQSEIRQTRQALSQAAPPAAPASPEKAGREPTDDNSSRPEKTVLK